MRAHQLFSACCVLGLLATTSATFAQGVRGRQQADAGQLILATYPVGDIVFQVTDYPDGQRPQAQASSPAGGGGFGGRGGGAFSVPDPGIGASYAIDSRIHFVQAGGGMRSSSRGSGTMGRGGMFGAPQASGASQAVTMDALIDAIVSCIATNSWSENGGGDAEISILGNMLVISQTHEIHKQISDFLTMVRRDASTRQTVSIDARWLLLDSDELDELLIESDKPGPSLVNAEVLNAFTRRPTSLRAITNCFNGQLVHVVSGTEKSIVSSWIPVVGSVAAPQPEAQFASHGDASFLRLVSDTPQVRESRVGYQPVRTTINLGVSLEVRPMLVRGEQTAIVDLSSTLNFSSGDQPGTMDLAPAVDRVSLETARLATTLRVPLGKPVLVGGLTYSPAAAMADLQATGDAQQPRRESRQAYFVLRVR